MQPANQSDGGREGLLSWRGLTVAAAVAFGAVALVLWRRYEQVYHREQSVYASFLRDDILVEAVVTVELRGRGDTWTLDMQSRQLPWNDLIDRPTRIFSCDAKHMYVEHGDDTIWIRCRPYVDIELSQDSYRWIKLAVVRY
jgi:hypothetical protein